VAEKSSPFFFQPWQQQQKRLVKKSGNVGKVFQKWKESVSTSLVLVEKAKLFATFFICQMKDAKCINYSSDLLNMAFDLTVLETLCMVQEQYLNK